jgi:hypothetical protein
MRKPQFKQRHVCARDDRFDVGLLLSRQRQILRKPFHDPFVMGSRAMLAPRGPLAVQE